MAIAVQEVVTGQAGWDEGKGRRRGARFLCFFVHFCFFLWVFFFVEAVAFVW